MSITNFKNPKGESISQVDIDSENFAAKSSHCSCINCDSIGCFEKRKKTVGDRCHCNICRKLRISTLSNRDLESAKKKIIREVVTRKTVESLKRVTETMFEFGSNENFGMITEKQSNLSDEKVITTPMKSLISNKTKCTEQRSVVQDLSTNLNQTHKEDNTAIKLSAQVMDVPYKEIHKSVLPSNEATEQNPLFKLNIFKRIKEIYEACSCKICECISSKPLDLRDEFCKCKPCQCQDCVKSRKKIEEKMTRIPHSGCPCIRCDRNDCRGIVKETCESQECDCNPRDSIQYPSNLTKRCKCEPCQCINCRLLGFSTAKTVKLGKVNEFIPREACQCSPCECIECKQICSRTNPTIICTHSKYRHCYRCNNCVTQRCETGEVEIDRTSERRNRAMRKSFGISGNNYDIRTVIVDNNSPFKQQKECNFNKHNTITLFSSLKSNYPSNSYNKSLCKCTVCECIVCSARDNLLKNYREHLTNNVISVHNNIKLPTPITNACKCTPCECKICSKKGEHENYIGSQSKCRCDVCDCLNCDNDSLATSSFHTAPFTPCSINGCQPAKPIRSMKKNKNCDCNRCGCSHCKNLFSCSSSVKFYSNGKSVEKMSPRLRKVMLITPSASESCFKSRKTYLGNVSSTALGPKHTIERTFGQNRSTCHAISYNYAPTNLPNSNKDQVNQIYQDSKEYVISDDDVHREMSFKLNNPVLDTASFKSVEESQIFNRPCEFTQMCFRNHKKVSQSQDKPREPKCKSFNMIHEQANTIISNDSDESLPVFWTCCNDTYPKRFSISNLKVVFNDGLNKTQFPENIQAEYIEKAKEISINQNFEDKLIDKSKTGNVITENIKHSNYNENYNYSCDDQRVDLCQQSHAYNDAFSTSIKNNSLKSTVNHFDITIDYERATRVLREAKAFSSKLIKMLDSFETANKQFESASQKFKVLHESLLDINESEHSTNLGRTCRPILKNENEAEREYEQSRNKPEDICVNFQYANGLTSTIHDTSETTHINKNIEKSNDMNAQENEIDMMNIIGKSNSQLEFHKAFNKVKTLLASENVHDSDAININSNQGDFNNRAIGDTENKNNVNIIQTTTVESVTKKLKSVSSNITTADTVIATDVENIPTEFSKQKDKQPGQIFKKNLYLNARTNDKRTILQSPILELDVKEAIQAISLQTTNSNYATKVVARPNETLAKLQNEVKDILNMLLLQITSQFKHKTDVNLFPRSKCDVDLKSMSSTASSQTYNGIIKTADKEVYFNINTETNNISCDQLKAGFIGLRRVSDHTVLVKWDMPKRVKDVKGYELLVDGRAVQKIFSPTRSMAVVSCLPHTERVLLTIRTIATTGCGHTPTNSIVYHPRTK